MVFVAILVLAAAVLSFGPCCPGAPLTRDDCLARTRESAGRIGAALEDRPDRDEVVRLLLADAERTC